MTDPLETAAGAAGPRATEAFSILANETRLSILLALWEAAEPFADDDAITFSALREAVGMRDSGQFNYHLGKLEGPFVRKTAAGYELKQAGEKLVRTVIAGAGTEAPTVERTPIDMECSFCGAQAAVTYEDEWLYIVCPDCEGFFQGEAMPEGALSGMPFDPAGIADRSPEELFRAAMTAGYQDIQSAIEGVCDACSGPMETSLHVCDDHADEGVCERCGRRFAVMARYHCPICKYYHNAPPRTVVAFHPAVIGFYWDRGVPFQYETTDWDRFRERLDLSDAHEQELVSTDPVRVRVAIEYAGDRLAITLDESMAVLEVTESTAQ